MTIVLSVHSAPQSKSWPALFPRPAAPVAGKNIMPTATRWDRSDGACRFAMNGAAGQRPDRSRIMPWGREWRSPRRPAVQLMEANGDIPDHADEGHVVKALSSSREHGCSHLQISLRCRGFIPITPLIEAPPPCRSTRCISLSGGIPIIAARSLLRRPCGVGDPPPPLQVIPGSSPNPAKHPAPCPQEVNPLSACLSWGDRPVCLALFLGASTGMIPANQEI